MAEQAWPMDDPRYDGPRSKQPGEPNEAKAPPKNLDLSKDDVIILTAYIWDPDVPAPGPIPENPWKAIDVIVKVTDLQDKLVIRKGSPPEGTLWEKMLKKGLIKFREFDDPPAKPIKLRGI